MPKLGRLHELAPKLLQFHCPGCKYGHAVAVNGRTMPDSEGRPVSWTWNGNYEKPTFTPSLLINKNGDGGYPRCHLLVTDGRLNFLTDSTHQLAGKMVEMEPCE
jgi:hypothetical protein